jgi:glycerol-3-phosphate dehydrogenase
MDSFSAAAAAEYLRAEAVHAVTHEGARHLDDVLVRRTRLSIETSDRGMAAAPVVAELIAPHLGWSEADVLQETRRYRAGIAAELQSEAEPDDSAGAGGNFYVSARPLTLSNRQP